MTRQIRRRMSAMMTITMTATTNNWDMPRLIPSLVLPKVNLDRSQGGPYHFTDDIRGGDGAEPRQQLVAGLKRENVKFLEEIHTNVSPGVRFCSGPLCGSLREFCSRCA
jgi:hypothetical protein